MSEQQREYGNFSQGAETSPVLPSPETTDNTPEASREELQRRLDEMTKQLDAARQEVAGLKDKLDEAHMADALGAAEIAKLEAALHQAHKDARTEQLTNLSNELAFKEKIQEIVDNREELTGSVIVLISLDVNSFKGVNDNLGHGVGDKVLKMLAAHLSDAVRYGDLVVRKGGDELVVLASISQQESNNGDPERVRTRVDSISERLRDDIVRFTPPEVKGIKGFGVSVGSASLVVGPDTTTQAIENTLKASDEAMYRDKENIKNMLAQEQAA